MEKAIIRVSRGNHFFGMVRRLKVYLNGEVKGYVHRDTSTDIEVSPGRYLLYVKMDWCSSKVVEIDIGDGEQVEYRAHTPGANSLWGIFRSLFDMIFSFNDFFQLEQRAPAKHPRDEITQ
ncbi:MAG: hypothetical protein U5J63_09105 [Fodinibius sp.]|nr:hypothetical protein [Fodinibius sp.]